MVPFLNSFLLFKLLGHRLA